VNRSWPLVALRVMTSATRHAPRGLFRTVLEPARAARSFTKPLDRASAREERLRGTLAYAPMLDAPPPRAPRKTAAVPLSRRSGEESSERGPTAPPARSGIASRLATLGLARPTVLPPEGTSSYEPFGARRRFEVERSLGRGAMGEVRLVRDNDLGRRVAVKEANDDAPVDRFVAEIRTLGHLDHPNIVPLHDVGMDDEGRYFFVMRHVEGETLDAVIARLRAGDPDTVERYSFERRIEVVLGILHALEHAHEIGILHRDLKPENVMIGRHGEVQLMDWGVAVPFRPGSETTTDEPRGSVVGTPWFMSPEQARGEADTLDARSDLFAVGVLFHELLTLDHYLGQESDPARVVSRVGTEGWRSALLAWHRGPGPMPPMELFHFVHRAMAFERERRWPSARHMIEELHRILDGRVRVQCPITLVKSSTRGAGRFVDRHPWTSFALFAATVSLAAYGAFGVLFAWG
jgi:serine/threonine protein kinase